MQKFISYTLVAFLSLVGSFQPLQCSAQYGLSNAYIGFNGLSGSQLFPSKYDLGERRVMIAGGLNVWSGQSFVDFGTVYGVLQDQELTKNTVNRILGDSRGRGILGIGVDWQLFALGLQFRPGSRPLNLSFGITERIGANFSFSTGFLEFAWRGNKPFAGRWLGLGPTTLNSTWNREFALGFSLPVLGSMDKFGLQIGARAKYILGITAAYTRKGKASIYTDPEGEYIDMALNYELLVSGPFDNFTNFNNLQGLFSGSGHGFAFDLGATGYLTQNFEVSISALDVGRMFYRNAKRYSQNGLVRFEGMAIGNLFGDSRLNVDSLVYLFAPNEDNANFNMPLGTRIVIQAEYKTPRETKKGLPFNSNTVYLTYIQGVGDLPGATLRPFVSVGYSHCFAKVFTIGVNGGYGGFNNWQAGVQLGFDIADVVKFAIGSDNLLGFAGLARQRVGNGVDVFMHGSLAFGRMKR